MHIPRRQRRTKMIRVYEPYLSIFETEAKIGNISLTRLTNKAIVEYSKNRDRK